jgi:hypothetical protein
MKQKEILRQRERLARGRPSAAEIVRGSLLERTIRHRQGWLNQRLLRPGG